MKGQRWLLVLLILLAFARGAWSLGSKSFWWDESLSLYRARQDLAGVLSNQTVLTDNVEQVVTVDNHPPLYFLLLWATVRLAGDSEFALRFPSLAFATLIVPLLYCVGRRLRGRWTGLAAATLGAVSPMYLWYGQEARGYTLLACLGLLSFYLFLRAFFDKKRWGGAWIALYIAVSVSLILAHYLGAMLVGYELLVLALLFAGQTISKRDAAAGLPARRAGALTILILLAAMALPLAYIWLNRPDATIRAGFRFIPLLNLLRDLLNSFSLGLSVDVGRWYVLLLDLVFLALLLAGLAWLLVGRRGQAARRTGWLLAGYLVVPVLLTYLLSYVRPIYMNSRHLILVTPAFYLLVGAGLSAAGRVLVTRPALPRGARLGLRAGFVALCALLLSGVAYATFNYFVDPAYDKDHHREWGAYLREHVRAGDAVIVDSPCIAELYDYYGSSSAPWIGLPLLTGPRQQTVDKLMELVGSYDRVWLAFSHTPPWCDPRRYPEKWLNQHAFRVDYQEFESYASVVLVAAYVERRPDVTHLPDGSFAVEARYSPALSLSGYRPVSAAQAGQPLHVELFWTIDEPIDEEASVVLRLVDAEGHVWGQGEQCPFNGMYPMWQWEPGITLKDEHQLSIDPGTPPGTYELEATLVRRPSEQGCLGEPGGPLAPLSGATARGDRVLLGRVEVGRADLPASLAELRIETPRHVAFGGIELLGEQMSSTERRPGDPIDVTLFWQAREAPLPDARFRLTLTGPQGRVYQETIVRPAGAGYPSDRWQVGDRFKGQFRIWLAEDAPPGRYTLSLTPEPPLRTSGLLASVRYWLGCIGKSCGPSLPVHLGRVEVLPTEQQGGAVPPPPANLEVPQPRQAVLGGQVRLLGFDLSAGSVQAGETLSLKLYWQGLRSMELSYHVFNHLAGPAGAVVAQRDGVPREGAYPTNLWQPGEVVVDSYQIGIDASTPPGVYALEVGMYRLETLKRLPMVDEQGRRLPDDRLILAQITVLPAPTPVPPPPVYRRYLPSSSH